MTYARAQAAGAVVRRELLPGKGNVARRMFADIEADVFIMVDGDDTYTRPRLDANSGHSFPALSAGFEIETELTIHALQLRLPIAEVETKYGERSEYSKSKLNTFQDGIRILMTIARLVKEEKPFELFTIVALVLATVSLILVYPVIEFFRTGLVPRLPTAVLATGLMLSALLNQFCGIILQTVTRGRDELKRLHYLSVPLSSPDHEKLDAHVRDNRIAHQDAEFNEVIPSLPDYDR